MKSSAKLLTWVAILAMALLGGCESDEGNQGGGTNFPQTKQGYLDQGWYYYGVDNYFDAYNSFELAVTMADEDVNALLTPYFLYLAQGDTAAADSYFTAHEVEFYTELDYILSGLSGVGWTAIKDDNPSTGTLAFDNALNNDPNYQEALAGYGLLLMTIEEWQASNEKLSAVIDHPDTTGGGVLQWDFAHDNTTDYLDLRLARALNYYNLADFQLCLDEVVYLTSGGDLPYTYEIPEGLPPSITAPEDIATINLATVQGLGYLVLIIEDLDNNYL